MCPCLHLCVSLLSLRLFRCLCRCRTPWVFPSVLVLACSSVLWISLTSSPPPASCRLQPPLRLTLEKGREGPSGAQFCLKEQVATARSHTPCPSGSYSKRSDPALLPPGLPGEGAGEMTMQQPWLWVQVPPSGALGPSSPSKTQTRHGRPAVTPLLYDGDTEAPHGPVASPRLQPALCSDLGPWSGLSPHWLGPRLS